MVTLKRKIKVIESLPPEDNKKNAASNLISIFIIIIILGILIFIGYKLLMPYFNAVDINKIIGKRINITKCNTKDYIIINQDKSYSLSLTNENCETKHYEGNLKIKNNEIIFENSIKGIIDNNYNIIINNNLFESEKWMKKLKRY